MLYRAPSGTLYYKPDGEHEPVIGEVIIFRVIAKDDPYENLLTQGEWYIVERVIPQPKE